MQPKIRHARPAGRNCRLRHRWRVSGNTRDLIARQERVYKRREPGCVPRLADDRPSVHTTHHIQKPRHHRAVKCQRWRQLEGSGPRFSAKPSVCARNAMKGSRAHCTFRSYVIARGIFTANRNAGGVLAHHFAYVVAACGRWNDELISAQSNRREYRSRCVPGESKRDMAARGIDQPAVPTRMSAALATTLRA
jgi:hypothetical protein